MSAQATHGGFLVALTATDVLSAADYADAESQAEPLKLEMFDHLRDAPDTYFVQLARDNHNAPLIRAGEIVVADQGGPQWGGWLPTEGGLFVIEYRGGLNDYPDQRYPRVSHRSAEHTSELQYLIRTSYAVFSLKNKHT